MAEIEFDYASKQLRDSVEKIYHQSEILKLLAWEAVSLDQEELEWSGKISSEDRKIDARAEYATNQLKITVNEILQRRKKIDNASQVPASLLRHYWIENIVRSVEKLNSAIRFEKALCVIRVYARRDVGWDVDNRAISYIINALRVAGIIPGDEWDKLSLLLLGGIDKENPRTEIFVREYPDLVIKNLLGES